MPKEPHHIIAIGASAGGLEEINSFFDHTPLDGVSYIIIQHLSPEFKSRMVELLARHSKLEVKQAENEMIVSSNKVYLIPNDKFMTIRGSKLYLTDKNKVQGPHLTINKFFNSLALDCGRKSIGVILSGLGSDGSEGVKAIKNAGGMVIARDPETSEFGSMPSNAIATGAVDFILEPESMPGTIEGYLLHDEELMLNDKDDEKNLIAITNLIKQQSPLDFTDYKQSTILRRIKRRAASNNFINLEDYIDFLKSTPEEVKALAQDFLISVTSFFRDKEAFDFLNDSVIPGIIKKLVPGEELKMWVAGCATGEEAYSIAILVSEQLSNEHKDTVVKIFATDIDTVALVNASKGIYSQPSLKAVPSQILSRYFTSEGSDYKVKPDLRKMVIFAKHDLVKNPPYCNMHFISCRNLLIYMTPSLQKKIFLLLLFGLKVEGILFLGSSENPMPIIENLEEVNKKFKIYKNIETRRLIRFDAFSLPEFGEAKNSVTPVFHPASNQTAIGTLAELVNVTLANNMNYLIVCIDENNHVVKTYGDTSKYLLQKNFNVNLLELMPRPLVVAFNTLSITALKSNKQVSVNGIKVNDQNNNTMSLSVTPLAIKKGEHKMLMVTFSTDTPEKTGHPDKILFDEKIYLDQYTLNLEEELIELKDKLHASYLQLDSSNENMQSFNEELLSANEEMQSTNEEMQSVNEELHTINSEYQLKNKELVDLNDDLNNYFRSNINGQLFVNNDLILMKFSPGTVKQINLVGSDVGRPLSNISTNIKFETIIEDIKKVIQEGTILTKEIETNNGKWYQVMTMPYIKSSDHTISGAIITFNDITEIKKTQDQLDKKNKSLLRINADLDNFIHSASHDLLAPLANIEVSIAVMNQIKVTDSKLNHFLTVINSSIKKFSTLINDIATIAKLESEMIEMEMVDINELIENVEWSLDNKIKTSGAVIHRDLEIEKIYFSKKNLRSIIYNLISNSIKFRGNEIPVINIRTAREKEYIMLSVQDNGIGIAKDDLAKIFDMYGRLHRDVEGQGIGLYLANKIVNASNGSIVVESEPGKGSKFIIHFKEEKDPLKVTSLLN